MGLTLILCGEFSLVGPLLVMYTHINSLAGGLKHMVTNLLCTNGDIMMGNVCAVSWFMGMRSVTCGCISTKFGWDGALYATS